MLIEGRLHAVVDLRGLKHLAVLGMVAHSLHLEDAVALHHLGAAQHAVGGVGGVLVEVLLAGALVADRLARKRRLVDIEAYRLQQPSVSGNLGARGENHDVAHHNVLLGNGGGVAIADHLHRLVVVHLVQYGELLVGL